MKDVSIINDLLDSNLPLDFENEKWSPEAAELYAERKAAQMQLWDSLTPEQQKLFDAYWIASCGVISVIEKRTYRLGTQFGFRFALEMLDDDPHKK